MSTASSPSVITNSTSPVVDITSPSATTIVEIPFSAITAIISSRPLRTWLAINKVVGRRSISARGGRFELIHRVVHRKVGNRLFALLAFALLQELILRLPFLIRHRQSREFASANLLLPVSFDLRFAGLRLGLGLCCLALIFWVHGDDQAVKSLDKRFGKVGTDLCQLLRELVILLRLLMNLLSAENCTRSLTEMTNSARLLSWSFVWLNSSCCTRDTSERSSSL